MTKALIPVLAVVAAASATFAIIQMNEVDGLKDQVAGLNSRIVAQEKSLADALRGLSDANGQLTTLTEDNARLKKERDEAKSRSAVAATDSSWKATDGRPLQGGGDMRALFQGFAKQMDDPEFRKMMQSNQERMIAGAYESLFKKLNLSEEDSKLVAELLSSRNMAALDQGRKLMNGKADEASMQAVRKEIQTTKEESDAKIKGMLGEDKFKELTNFEHTVGDQRALDGFARNFERKSMPLQAEQKDALSNIMREERLKFPGNEIPDLGGGPGMSILKTDAELKTEQEQEKTYQENVINRAGQAGLSPDQINGLRDSFKERNDRRAMSRFMGRAMLGGGGPGGR
jgi:hypothetical protein